MQDLAWGESELHRVANYDSNVKLNESKVWNMQQGGMQPSYCYWLIRINLAYQQLMK